MQLGAACAVLVFAATACQSTPNSATERRGGSATTSGPIALDTLVAGDCLRGLVVGQSERIELKSTTLTGCREAHELEVFATFPIEGTPRFDDEGLELPPGYPGRQRVIDAADVGCTDRLVEIGATVSDYGLLAIWPTASSWTGGDRTVACAVYRNDGTPFVGRTL